MSVLFNDMKIKLSKRLIEVSKFIRTGSLVADIGTDHAYLPVYLILNNIAKSVIASDINEKPCLRAMENIDLYGFGDRIKVINTNGLNGIEKYKPRDIVIAGMGGDMISEIIEHSVYVRNSEVRLILQPMTKIPRLREYLLKSGFDIIDEALVKDDKLYSIIYARYDGKVHKWSGAELLIGKRNIQNNREPLSEHITLLISELEKIIAGKKRAGLNTDKNKSLMDELIEMKNKEPLQ